MTQRELLWLAFGILIGYLIWEEWKSPKLISSVSASSGNQKCKGGFPPKCQCGGKQQ